MSTPAGTITLTDSLTRRLRALQDSENKPDLKLRVAVLGGGCSGFQYEFSFADALETGDVLFERDGVGVIVDETSLELLDGSAIDYAEELIGASFQIKNPNAKSSCGCGTSFSL
jgi:iron-sulfur cluster insertion protein